jgi:hypothetical protein
MPSTRFRCEAASDFDCSIHVKRQAIQELVDRPFSGAAKK